MIAHRGNRVGAPENTLESFRQALSLGADALEFDVRMTRDLQPVVIHDATLDRTTSGHGLVVHNTLADLRTLDAGAHSEHAKGERHLIPTLEEVLDAFRDVPLVIEVKELGAVEATERMVRKVGAHERVLIGSANIDVVERFYRTGLMTCASMLDALAMMPFALIGIDPPRPRYNVLSLTPRFRGIPIPVVRMARAAARIGLATQVWTVNDPAEARALWAGGVAGIVTDDPSALLRARSA